MCYQQAHGTTFSTWDPLVGIGRLIERWKKSFNSLRRAPSDDMNGMRWPTTGICPIIIETYKLYGYIRLLKCVGYP